MNNIASLKTTYQQAIAALPWQNHQISLLLDGINTPKLLQLLYANNAIKKFELLYMQTKFAEIKEVSPCLIALDSAQSYPLQKMIDNLSEEWGYLLASQQPWQEQIQHLRQLLIVQDQTEQKMLLKIADPQVITALLQNAIQQQNTTLFGPFSQILSYDIIDNSLHQLQRPPTQTIAPITPPYKLSQQETLLLDQVDIKRANQIIYNHMDTYFPTFMAQQTEPKKTIDKLITEAEEKDYTSTQEQLYYLNIHGYLGLNALNEPNIAHLIANQDIESLKEAAHMAEQIAEGIA